MHWTLSGRARALVVVGALELVEVDPRACALELVVVEEQIGLGVVSALELVVVKEQSGGAEGAPFSLSGVHLAIPFSLSPTC